MILRSVIGIVGRTVAVAVVALTAVFFLVQVLPGDPALVIAGLDAPPESVEAIRVKLSLDRPVGARYLDWLAQALTGDLGTSVVQGQSVTALIAPRLGVTLRLAAIAFCIGVVVSLLLGTLSAFVPRARWPVRTVEYVAFAFPQFWVALLLLLLFAVRRRWFPMFGADSLRHLVLPAVALSLGNIAVLSRTVRASLLEGGTRYHLVAARAFGLSWWRTYWVHALPSALIPIATVGAIQVGYLLAGAIVIEQVFSIPGLGQLAITAAFQRDLPVLQGTVLVFAMAFPLANGLADLVVLWLDPRSRLAGTASGR